jgi:TolB-like protein
LIGLAFALLSSQPGFAQSVSKRLAVLEFKGKIDSDVLDTFADAVRGGAVEGLAGREVEVLTRENMMVLIREMGKKDCTEGDCEVETARNIGADFVMSGTVARVDDAFVVTLKMHETKRGSLLATNQIDAKTQLEVLRQLRELGRKMVASNNGSRPAPSVAQTQPPAVAEPSTPAPPAQSSANPEASPSEIAALARKGPHFGFEVGAGPWVSISPRHSEPYASVGVFLDVGLSRAVDVRVGLRIQGGTLDRNSAFLVGIPVSLRLNIRSVYAIVLGVNAGVRGTKVEHLVNVGSPPMAWHEGGIFVGPEVSLLNFRFGEKRDFELAVVQGYAVSVAKSMGVNIFYNTFVFSMLW